MHWNGRLECPTGLASMPQTPHLEEGDQGAWRHATLRGGRQGYGTVRPVRQQGSDCNHETLLLL